MNWIHHLTTRAKLLFGFGVLLFLLAAAVATAVWSLREIEEAQRSLMDRDLAVLETISEMRDRQDWQRIRMLDAMISEDARDRERNLRLVQEGVAAVNRAVEKLATLLAGDPSSLQRVSELRSAVDDYRRGRADQLAQINAGRLAEARQLCGTQQEQRFE